MKKIHLVIFFISIGIHCCYSQSGIRVDPLLELSGIAWRMADAREYQQNEVIDSYANDIDDYFVKYKNHPLIGYIKQLRQAPHKIGYDGVPTSTMLMLLKDGTITLNPKIDIDRYVKEFDPRWDRQSLVSYTTLLNDFYKKSRFDRFFNNHQELYDRAKIKIDSLFQTIDTEWFETFYGASINHPTIYVCLSYGYNNYALTSKFMNMLQCDDYGIIIGCTVTDKTGLPDFNGRDRSVIVHEIGHNFANPIIEKYNNQLLDAGNIIFSHVKDRLSKIGYGTAETMLGEGLNELFMNMYYVELYKTNPSYNIAFDEEGGFIWMSRAIRFMDNFQRNRNLYPTIADFMPELIGFMNHTAQTIETVMLEFENRHPYVVGVYPAQHTNVATDIKEIRIQYSQSMLPEITGRSLPDDLNCKALPVKRMYWADATYVIEIDSVLENNTIYGITIPRDVCVASMSGHKPLADFTMTFKTIE